MLNIFIVPTLGSIILNKYISNTHDYISVKTLYYEEHIIFIVKEFCLNDIFQKKKKYIIGTLHIVF